MQGSNDTEGNVFKNHGFMRFATKRVALGIALAIGILWLLMLLLGTLEGDSPAPTAEVGPAPAPAVAPAQPAHPATAAPPKKSITRVAPSSTAQSHETVVTEPAPLLTIKKMSGKLPKDQAAHLPPPKPAPSAAAAAAPPAAHAPVVAAPGIKGMAFVDALIRPMAFELNERFWGWRPNDILDFTDNVNNFQLGVLEVTRRTIVALTERISRTGTTASFDPNLENAMNWFMVKATRYWFPSPESKYRDGLKELRKYHQKLGKNAATFYTRSDNLIPLLAAYEDLLGSCDQNLVKTKEEDGGPVSHFTADNYFFYAQGVASAMETILQTVLVEFAELVETRRGTEVLHHALESLHEAVEITPWLITNSDLSGVLANHRANMAAPISHARFYIGVLIKALST